MHLIPPVIRDQVLIDVDVRHDLPDLVSLAAILTTICSRLFYHLVEVSVEFIAIWLSPSVVTLVLLLWCLARLWWWLSSLSISMTARLIVHPVMLMHVMSMHHTTRVLRPPTMHVVLLSLVL